MKTIFVLIIASALFLGHIGNVQADTPVGSSTNQTSLVQDTALSEIRSLFSRHNDYFSRGKAKEISLNTIRAPFWFGSDPVALFSSSQEIEARFDQGITTLREQGYDHSEIIDLSIKLLNTRSAIVDMTYRRFLKDGTVMGNPNRQATYLVLRTDKGWRITALIPIQK